MKAFLMHRDQDFDLKQNLPSNANDLIQDLELTTLFDAMARGDKFLLGVAKEAVLSSLKNPEDIVYRQQILVDCLEHATIVREIYKIALDAIKNERTVWRSLHYPDSILSSAIDIMELFVVELKKLRRIADAHCGEFRSEGFVRLFGMLKKELDDEYFRTVEVHLKELEFEDGVLISAELGKGSKGINYVLRRTHEEKPSWLRRMLNNVPLPMIRGKPPYSFEIADRDEAGHDALSRLRGRGINLVANALSQSTDHILSFFEMLLIELGFYIGCLNLSEQILQKGGQTCIPTAKDDREPRLSAEGLYDICLALKLENKVIGNNLVADNKELVIITGANQGGKSTFLRSIGLAHLMMQCGMFVAAERFSSNVCQGVFTHFKREEDATMKSGKLDEELKRMSDIGNDIKPNCILLCNESFQSTNESEGSEIARQIIRAMLDCGIKVFYVTFLYDFAQRYYQQHLDSALFLRAERQSDGRRTFRLVEGEPLSTAYGEDLYKQIFGASEQIARAPHADVRP